MHKRVQTLLGCLGMCWGLTIPAEAGGPYRVGITPWLRRDDQPDTSDLARMAAAFLRSSERETALAAYEFIRRSIYHWPAAREGETPDHFEYGVVYDPIKLINVYGYGYCYQNRSALAALWQKLGLNTRSVGLSGHSAAEVYFDGRWNYLDADFHGYVYLEDGVTIASVEDLAQRPDLLMRPRRTPDPFFPAFGDPRALYESAPLLAAMFASREDNFYQHNKIVTGHRMDFVLLPGMRFTRRFRGDGRWNVSPRHLRAERLTGYVEIAEGPRDRFEGDGYGVGELLYQPDLSDRTSEYADGVWFDRHTQTTARGLEAAHPGQEAVSVFRIRLPYVIVGWPTSLTEDAPPVGAAVLAGRFVRTGPAPHQAIEISTDEGRTWTGVWEAQGAGTDAPTVDVSRFTAGRYEYWIRLRQQRDESSEAIVERFTLRTAFQCAPRSLPALRAGANRMRLSLEAPRDVTEWRMNPAEEKWPQEAVEVVNLHLREGQIIAEEGGEGYAVFLFRPPSGTILDGAHLHIGARREPHKTGPEDRLRLSISNDEGRTWENVWSDEYPPYARHWSYHGNVQLRLDRPEALYVRLDVATRPSAAVRDFRIHLYWRPLPMRRESSATVRVIHHWREHGEPRQFEQLFDGSADYTVLTTPDVVIENESVTIEWARLADIPWREDEAVATPPPMPDPGIDRERQAKLRRYLTGIRDRPLDGLRAAAEQTEFPDLARQAQQALRLLPTSLLLPD